MLKIEEMCKNICLIQKKLVPLHPQIRNNDFATGGYQSGQMGQTVNLLVFTFGGSNPSPPTKDATDYLAHLFIYGCVIRRIRGLGQ